MLFLNAHTHHSRLKDLEIFQKEKASVETWNSVGIHPKDVFQFTVNEISGVLMGRINSSTIAIGEIGLDSREALALKGQYLFFLAQAKWAEEEGLPVILHCVRAWEWILKGYQEVNPERNWVFHGFDKKNLVDQVLKCEKIMLSLGSAIVTKQKDKKWIKEIPLDRLLLETDDSNIAIEVVYESAASLFELPIEDLSQQIIMNFQKTYTKWQIG